MTRIRQIERVYEVVDMQTGEVKTRTHSLLAARVYSDYINARRRQQEDVQTDNEVRRARWMGRKAGV